MAIDFPDSPSNGDIHTVSGKRWQWDGEKWQAYGASLAPDVLYVDQGNARVGINDTTPSYSLDVTGTARVTGAITASGGVVGNVTGNASGTALTVTQAAQSAITSVGTLTGLTVSGDLTVGGTTTTINSTTLSVDDKNIELGSVATPSDTTADGGGITLKGASDKTILWTNSTDTWDLNQSANLATGLDYKVNNASVLNATTLGAGVTGSSLTSVGTLTAATISGDLTVGTSNAQILGPASGAASAGNVSYSFSGDTDTGFFRWNTNTFSAATAGATRMTWAADGKVGIGTTSPNNILHLAGTTTNHRLIFTNTANTAGKRGMSIGMDNDRMAFQRTDDSGNWEANYMIIDQDTGKVGIGTTSPSAPFHVYGSANNGTYTSSGTSNTAVYIKGTGTYPTALTLDGDGSSDDVVRVRYLNAGANKWQVNYGADIIWSSATWTERMRLTSAGLNVGGSIAAASGDSYPVVIGVGLTANLGNTAIGSGNLSAATGGNNVAIGYAALTNCTTSGWNTAVGNYALGSTTTQSGHPNYAQYSTAFGFEALYGNVNGSGGNVAVGFRAGKGTTVGRDNVMIGMQAGQAGTFEGNNNVAVGANAAPNISTGAVNTCVGPYAGGGLTTGSNNTEIGYAAGYANSTGSYNTRIGSEAARVSTDDSSITAVGYQALYHNSYVQNTAVGVLASFFNGSAANNTSIGYIAGKDTYDNLASNSNLITGGNNSCIGYDSRQATVSATNSINLGDANISSLRCATTTISTLSDERDKTDIVDLDMGLDFVRRLRPRRFVWADRHGGKVGIAEAGFVAQELQQAQADEGSTLPYLVEDQNPDKLEAAPSRLLPAMVLAIQELADKVDALT